MCAVRSHPLHALPGTVSGIAAADIAFPFGRRDARSSSSDARRSDVASRFRSRAVARQTAIKGVVYAAARVSRRDVALRGGFASTRRKSEPIEHGSGAISGEARATSVRRSGDAPRVSVIARLIATASVVPLSADRPGGMK